METSAIYGLSKLLGHHAVSMNAIIANRANMTFSKDPYAAVEKLIKYTLDKMASWFFLSCVQYSRVLTRYIVDLPDYKQPKIDPMKKLIYLFVFVFTTISFVSCGASSASCAESDKYIIKNMKFENQEMVLSKKFKSSDEIIN